VTLTGELLDPIEAEELAAAIDAAAAGGLDVDDRTTVRVLSESVQIVALQEEIEQIFELARTLDGQSPNFDVSLDELSTGATTTLDRVVVAMRRYPLPHADILGHTDATGSAASNLELSEERAGVVLQYTMTRTFIELGLLVVAAFALGLLVGWLAWGARQSEDAEQQDAPKLPPSRTTKRGRSAPDELPRWQGHSTPDETVIIGSQD